MLSDLAGQTQGMYKMSCSKGEWHLSSACLPRTMDLKVVCVLSAILVIALSTLAEGKAPPSKYLHLLLCSQFVCGHDPPDCNCSESVSPVYISRQQMSCSGAITKVGVYFLIFFQGNLWQNKKDCMWALVLVEYPGTCCKGKGTSMPRSLIEQD